ncbi:S49 family peptidase [Methylovulum miyakonense]|uniref:S49 family peptidase n=1 Tax=Methylovulum miyakonense TaxID=645578 RepID=UPI00037708BB|nr:S49 family peptidase [Methylovulum miyakonense]
MEATHWLGSLQQYNDYVARQEGLNAALLSGSITSDSLSSDPPEYFTLFGNVAVIDVTGVLTNDDSWRTWYFGDTSYNQIRRALFEAYAHTDAASCVINFDTGGGTPNGLSDLGNLIRQLTSMGFPIDGYTGGHATSAGYWAMSSCRNLYAGEVATVGSIGVITIHKDYSENLRQNGVKPTVIRSGDKKALGTPYEKLSDEAKAQIQEHSDVLHRVFSDRVAQYRGISSDFVWTNWANGQTWVGQQAKDAGLVDDVTTLDGLIATLQSQLDKKSNGKETTYMSKIPRPAMTEQQQAALLAGADPAVVLGTEAAAALAAETAAESSLEDSQTENTESALVVGTIGESEVVTFLKAELAAKDSKILELTSQLAEASNAVAKFEATHQPMKDIIHLSLQKMQVAMGGTPIDMSELPAETLLAQHAKTTTTFMSKFKVGGVAAVESEETDESSGPPVLDQARLQQNSFNKRRN